MKIKFVRGRQILDSRGNPTVECDIVLENGFLGRASVPSGASTGSGEALELRDGVAEYDGKGVSRAIYNINNVIAENIIGRDAEDQAEIDNLMIQLDGTENKSKLGANAILAVSLAVCKAAAHNRRIALWRYISELGGCIPSVPRPMINVINGGAHADFATDIQEYMIVPLHRKYSDNLRIGSEIFHALGRILKSENYPITVGDEGGYAPKFKNGNNEPLFLIGKAIESAGYKIGRDVSLALDVAASEFYQNGQYNLATDGQKLSNAQMIKWYQNLVKRYHVASIEDGLAENDWEGWHDMTSKLGDKIQIVGDDLLVTNTKLLSRAIQEKSANAILIKPNQIGTLTETVNAVRMAREAGFGVIISHRSGETEDTFIAHLATGLGIGQIKTGSMSRGERIAKYNELLRIDEQLLM